MPDSSAGTKEFYFVGSSQVAEDFDRVFHARVEECSTWNNSSFRKSPFFSARAVGEEKRSPWNILRKKRPHLTPISRVLFCDSGIETGDCQSRSGRALLAVLIRDSPMRSPSRPLGLS